ncbi:Rdl [Cordylochernes scorpioides]|uniref:Rdl n=1 Tax=Cordylochernes scorpioides TaxID=51811 RepID=A0ABY6LUC3_9ARAC|nr:Rdl [Cordylochernes scorpioides]
MPWVGAVGYPMKDIRYKWKENDSSVRISQSVELPQFKVVGLQISSRVVNLTTGKYSRLVCEITFVRSMGYYLIQIYIPAGLIVIISWVSFWLHRNATPARVALGVTTVLTMTTLMSSTNAAMPKISYVKSIDVYLGTCFVMVFASLLEYATVGYLAKRISMRKTRTQLMARLAEQHRQRCPAAATLPDPDHVLIPCHAPGVPLIKTAMLQKAFKDDCISRSQSGKWHKAFKEGREEVADEPRLGRPTTARTDENVDRVLEVPTVD